MGDSNTVAVQLTGFAKSKIEVFNEGKQDISPIVVGPHIWKLGQESFL